jgi:hypothetical protein
MKDAKELITAEDAKAMLNRSVMNETNKLLKGGVVSKARERELRRAIARDERAKRLKEMAAADRGRKRVRVRPVKPDEWEGTFNQKQRRYIVYMAKLGGKTTREIAAETGIDRSVVCRDLQAIEVALAQSLDTGQADRILNELLLDLEVMRWMALQAAAESTGNELTGCLNTATDITSKKIMLLQDAGVIRKAPTNLRHAGPDGQPLPAATGINVTVQIEDSSENKGHYEYEEINAADIVD